MPMAYPQCGRCSAGRQSTQIAKLTARLGFSHNISSRQTFSSPIAHAPAGWAESCRRPQSRPRRSTSVRAEPSSNGSSSASNAPQTPEEGDDDNGNQGKALSSIITVGGVAALIVAATVFQEPIKEWILYFSDIVDDLGYPGMILYFFVYAGLEVLAVPAIPLTMTSGAIYGPYFGSVIVSLSGTVAATIAFLIARYAARDRFLPWAEKNKQFRAVNKVISRDGFKVVTLLRLSPLLPLAASNYLYGLTSVSLRDYFIGTWVGMLPGTIAYVTAGHVSKVAISNDGELPLEWWQVALAAAVSGGVIWYIGSQAKKELANLEEEEAQGKVSVGTADASQSSAKGKSYTTAGRSDE